MRVTDLDSFPLKRVTVSTETGAVDYLGIKQAGIKPRVETGVAVCDGLMTITLLALHMEVWRMDANATLANAKQTDSDS